MNETKIALGDFNIIVKEKYSGKKLFTEEEIAEKINQAYDSGNGKEFLHWCKIHEEQYGLIDIIS